MSAAAAECIARAAWLLLHHRFPLAEMILFAQVGLDLIGKIMHHKQDAFNGRREGAQRPIQKRPSAYRQERLGRRQRVGT